MSTFLLLGLPFLPWLAGSFAAFLAVLLAALLMNRFASKSMGRLQARIAAAPLAVSFRGFVVAALAIGVSMLLVVSIIGIPFAYAIGTALSLASYVGLAAACSVLGAALPLESLRDRPVGRIVAGTTLAFLIAQVPLLGFLFSATLGFAGIGALVSGRREEPARLASAQG